MDSSVHFSSRSDDWATPQDFFDRLDAIFDFTLDSCADAKNAKCTRYFTRSQDGLGENWDGERVFMNPPYGREAVGAWVRKAAEARALVACLLPARTDTRWWHDYVVGGGGVVFFLKGRLSFGGAEDRAPFPSAVVIFFGDAIRNKP